MGESDKLEQQPWHRRDDESAKAYRAFRFYLNLGANDRSALEAWYRYARWNWGQERAQQERDKDLTSAPAWFKQWSADYDWTDRVEAWDDHLALVDQQQTEVEHRKKLEEHRDRQERFAQVSMTAATQLLTKNVEKIQKLQDEDIHGAKDLARLIRATTDAFRAATEAESQALAVERLLELLLDQE